MKIVINVCHGGYGLSETAILRYAELVGFKLYMQKESYMTHFYRIPVEEYNAIAEECRQSRDYTKSNGLYFTERDIERTDTHLIQVVEEMGNDADGKYAKLKIVQIPDGVQWQLDEYDGYESISEVHRSWS